MECTFVVGQKVVCINTWELTPGKGNGTEVGPVKGMIYTIREIGLLHPYAEGVSVRLKEIYNKSFLYARCTKPYEQSFGVFRFRPLTDIEQKVMNRVSLLKGITKDTVIRDDGMQNTKTPSKRRKRIVVEEYQ